MIPLRTALAVPPPGLNRRRPNRVTFPTAATIRFPTLRLVSLRFETAAASPYSALIIVLMGSAGTRMSTHTQTHMCMSTRTHTDSYEHTCIQIRTRARTCTHTHRETHTHRHRDTHIHTHARCACTHPCTHAYAKQMCSS